MRNAEEAVVESFPAQPAKLRVAIVTETFPPEVNGVAMTWGNLVNGLIRRAHAVQLIRPRQSVETAGEPCARHLQGVNQVLVKGVPIPNYPGLRFGLLSQGRFRQLWRQQRPDLVHVVTEGPLGWNAITAARQLQLPVTSSFHTNFHQYSTHYGMSLLNASIEAYLRKFHNRTRATMAPTPSLAQALHERGFQHVSVLSRGVAIGQFTPQLRSHALRKRWGIPGEKDSGGGVVALSVGRLAREKNVSAVLSAFAAMQTRLPSAKLVFVGDGPLRAQLEQACPQAHFAGIRTGFELGEHYASSDIFLFPSLTETYGNVVAEALASGLAVVSYNCAAAAQLIQHGHNGVLVKPGDESSFVDAAVDLATNDGQRVRLRSRAPASVAHLAWSAVTDTLVQTWRHVLQCHDSHGRATGGVPRAAHLTPPSA